MRKKNNARESAKISLVFSLAFILQIQQIFLSFSKSSIFYDFSCIVFVVLVL